MPHQGSYLAASDKPMLYPRYTRPKNDRVIAGVAAGLAQHLGVQVGWVRVALVVAAFLSGIGVGIYALLWMFSEPNPKNEPVPSNPKIRMPTYVGMACLGAIGALVTTGIFSDVSGWVIFAFGVVGLGAFLAWQAFDRDRRSVGNIIALIAGVAFVFSGVIAMAVLWEDGGFGGAVASVVVTLLGVGILVIPLILRLTSSLVSAREEKAVASQRAEIASRLHDSVLQTLALIQKRADEPDEVARLARGQERELRAWLFGSEEKTSTTVFAALNKAAGEVEDLVGVRISVVTVGEDTAFTHETEPIVLAAREAMLNAGKHAGVDSLDVYAEHLAGELSVYVRDRGQGFDVEDLPEDRHGVRDSIIERMNRAGGAAKIRSSSSGTEITVTMPVT